VVHGLCERHVANYYFIGSFPAGMLSIYCGAYDRRELRCVTVLINPKCLVSSVARHEGRCARRVQIGRPRRPVAIALSPQWLKRLCHTPLCMSSQRSWFTYMHEYAWITYDCLSLYPSIQTPPRPNWMSWQVIQWCCLVLSLRNNFFYLYKRPLIACCTSFSKVNHALGRHEGRQLFK